MSAVEIFRCDHCNRFTTDREIQKRKAKGCPGCGGMRYHGANSYSTWLWLKIQLRLI